MAMDALKNLVTNTPDWLQRLDDLSGQIDQRQAELAAAASAEGKSPEKKPLRNKGSTESLKPKDGPPVDYDEAPSSEAILKDNTVEDGARTSDKTHDPIERSTPRLACIGGQEPKTDVSRKRKLSVELNKDDHLKHRKGNKRSTGSLRLEDDPPVVYSEATANEDLLKDAAFDSDAETLVDNGNTPKVQTESLQNAQAQVGKKPKSPSTMSNDDAPAAYRTRSGIIVYYDSYVQGFFAELVRFVCSSGNLIRKARMAIRIFYSKQRAEQDVSEDGNDDEALPWLGFMGVCDDLDKGLEFVETMCERGAHRVLCDGDCNDEITKAQKRLAEVLETAKTEMERVQREEPELAKETGEMGKVRTRRPISMRREMSAGLKEVSPTPTKEENKLEPAKLEAADPTPAPDPMAPIAVDPDIMEADEGIDVEMEIPKLPYRSTRAMRSRGP